MKRKDILIIVIVLVAAAVLFVATPQGRMRIGNLFAPAATSAPTAEPTAEATSAPTSAPTEAATPAPTVLVTAAPKISSMFIQPEATPVPRPTLRPAESYVYITVGNYPSALLPLLEETTYSVKQLDGSENVVEIGPNRVKMQYSTCDNQDCVHQDEITLENRDHRVLLNMIVCLPNRVTLELLTPEEAQLRYEEMAR